MAKLVFSLRGTVERGYSHSSGGIGAMPSEPSHGGNGYHGGNDNSQGGNETV